MRKLRNFFRKLKHGIMLTIVGIWALAIGIALYLIPFVTVVGCLYLLGVML